MGDIKDNPYYKAWAEHVRRCEQEEREEKDRQSKKLAAYTEMVRDESKLLTLIELVNKGKITTEDAAEEVNMSVDDFRTKMKGMFYN